jgi:hypothetical protein
VLYLSVATALVASISMLNLVLVLGIIRRLREHTALLSTRSAGPRQDAAPMLRAGNTVEPFVATATTGETVSPASFRDGTIVGFLSVNCPACQVAIPEFVALARDAPGGRENVVAVLIGPPPETAALAAELAPVALIIQEGVEGDVARAFQVVGVPSFAVVQQDGLITATSLDPEALLMPIAS